MNFFTLKTPLCCIFAVFAGSLGIVSLLPAIATVIEQKHNWIFVSFSMIFLSILFFVSCFALLLKKNWGRLLLSFLLNLIIVLLFVLIGLLIYDFWNNSILLIIGGSGVLLIPILAFITLVTIIHSKLFKKELLSESCPSHLLWLEAPYYF